MHVQCIPCYLQAERAREERSASRYSLLGEDGSLRQIRSGEEGQRSQLTPTTEEALPPPSTAVSVWGAFVFVLCVVHAHNPLSTCKYQLKSVTMCDNTDLVQYCSKCKESESVGCAPYVLTQLYF